MKAFSFTTAVAALVACGLWGTAALGAVEAYDPFESGGANPGPGQYNTSGYPDDVLAASKLNDQGNIAVAQGPALTGFPAADPWQAPGGSEGEYAKTVYFKTETGGLTYPSLPSVAGQLRYRRNSGNTLTKRVWRDATTSDVGAVQWLGFLLDADAAFAGSSNDFDVELRWNITQSGGATDRPLTISFDGDGSTEVVPSFAATGNESIGGTGAALAADQTHFFLVRLEGDVFVDGDFQNGRLYDAVTVYVDPDLSQGEANLGNTSAEVLSGRGIIRDHIFGALDNTRAPFGNIEFQSALSAGSNVIFDEFRVATQFSDFVASTIIPEPSTLLIWSLLAGLGIIGWRRRRSK